MHLPERQSRSMAQTAPPAFAPSVLLSAAAGALNVPSGIWVGGTVTSQGTHPATQAVTDTTRGPANEKVYTILTVP